MNKEKILVLIEQFDGKLPPTNASNPVVDDIMCDLQQTFSDYISWERAFKEGRYDDIKPFVDKHLQDKIDKFFPEASSQKDYDEVVEFFDEMNKIIEAMRKFLKIS